MTIQRQEAPMMAWLNTKRSALVERVKGMLVQANEDLHAFVGGLTVPTDVHGEFDRLRRETMDQLDAIQDVLRRAAVGSPKGLIAWLWEAFVLQGNLWTLQRFESRTLQTLQRKTLRLFRTWMMDVRARALERCAQAEDHVFAEKTRYRTLAPDYAVILTSFALIRERVRREETRIVDTRHGLPTAEQVRAHEALAQSVARIWASAERVTNPNTEDRTDSTPPAPVRRKWMFH